MGKLNTNIESSFNLPALLLVVTIILVDCVDKMVLPDSLSSGDFSAGDTTYLLINPIWDDGSGLVNPVDLSVAPDGRVFVADSGAHSIFVFEQSGNVINEGFEDLVGLKSDKGNPLAPVDVDIDRKMNVLYIDGSDQIYRWNQYWNEIGIDSIAITADFVQDGTNDTISATYRTDVWLELVNRIDWTAINYTWAQDSVLIDSLLKPHLFYDGDWIYNQVSDRYYPTELSQFSAISSVENGTNHLFVADYYNNRIVEVAYYHNAYLKLKSGEKVWIHGGVFYQTVQGWGTGAGTVNKPLGIDMDYEDNIYYCQSGENFAVHKIKYTSAAGYVSSFQLYSHDVMDLGRFSQPQDVAVDNNQMIYVSNTNAREIQVFNADGSFFRKAGIEDIRIDKEDWVSGDSTLIIIDSTDTYYIIEQKGLLVRPAGITVDDRGVIYICDTPTSRIIRFRLSNLLDEDLTPVQ